MQYIVMVGRKYKLLFPEFIVFPILGIIDNIICNAMIGLFITNDMFMVIPLPQFTHVIIWKFLFEYCQAFV